MQYEVGAMQANVLDLRGFAAANDLVSKNDDGR
jgi:hypothetical protein